MALHRAGDEKVCTHWAFGRIKVRRHRPAVVTATYRTTEPKKGLFLSWKETGNQPTFSREGLKGNPSRASWLRSTGSVSSIPLEPRILRSKLWGIGASSV